MRRYEEASACMLERLEMTFHSCQCTGMSGGTAQRVLAVHITCPVAPKHFYHCTRTKAQVLWPRPGIVR